MGPKREEEMIAITLKLVTHEEQQNLKVKMPKGVKMSKVKERVEAEFDIPTEEQIILFRGKYIAKRYMTQKENAFQPLNMPDLEEIVSEAGEDGLQMTVIHHPFRLENFMKEEEVEEGDYDVKLRQSGASLLHRAVRRCEISVVQELLVKEAFTRANARDRAGQTALHAACTAWQRESAQIILDSDKFEAVYKKDMDGRTALHYVACLGGLGGRKVDPSASKDRAQAHSHGGHLWAQSIGPRDRVRSRQGGGGDERDLGLQGRG